MPTHITSRADDTKGFMNLGCGEAIKLLFEHDGCSSNSQLGLPHVKTNSAPEWQSQLCGDQRNCKQMGKGNHPAAQTHCVCLCSGLRACVFVCDHMDLYLCALALYFLARLVLIRSLHPQGAVEHKTTTRRHHVYRECTEQRTVTHYLCLDLVRLLFIARFFLSG